MRHPMQTLRFLAVAVAVGGALAPLWARGAGDPTPFSNAPMVVVVNPGRGSVVGNPFRLQVHAASPTAGGAIASVAYTTNGTAPNCAGTSLLPVNTRYDGGAGGAIYETNVSVAAAGSYTVRVCARNAAGTVEAPAVALTVTDAASPGDGNLLVRDNSNQLCTDCHALQSHTSQSTSNKYGSWANTCRDCHVPHGTRNIFLLGERITPPDVHGADAAGARDVRMARDVGDSGVAGATLPAQSSFVNSDNSGPCQVCHTQTQGNGGVARFRQSGNADTHFTGAGTQNCATCHLHTKGFAGSCTTCHGDSSRVGEQTSPPIDTCGATTGGRVGAHQSHLNGRLISVGVNCADCHLNPPVGGHPTWASCDPDPAHHAIMTWGALSRTVLPGDAGTVTPTWDPATQTCSNYCHGDFKNGNRVNTVTWNGTAACGSCHGQAVGNPLPPAPHPQNATCGSCHSTGYSTTTVVAALHVDGLVDDANFTCHSCHGSATNDAPPIAATVGNANAIGAHQAHLLPGSAALTDGFACVDCHVDNTGNMGHSNGAVNMVWGALASQGITPSWNAGLSTCANYCHGNAATQSAWGGTDAAAGPNWLTVNGTYRACASCHGSPPPLNATTHHPFNTACATCHGTGYATTGISGPTALGNHVNGTIQTSRTGCTLCHGDLTATGVANTDLRVAPGYNAAAADTTGALAATAAAVGAHRAHLVNTTFRSTPIACGECHAPATDTAHATGGGTGGARATLTWGATAANSTTFDARTPAYAGSSTNANGATAGSCASTYCHAPRLADTAAGLNLAPTWNVPGSVACGDCHGLPPVTAQHPVGATNCGGCHPGYTISSVNLASHLDGTLQYTPSGCSSCHGDQNRAPVATATATDITGTNLVRASPPADHLGGSTGAAVGAHLMHVNQGATAPALSNALACTNCHNPDPATYTVTPTPHANGTGTPVFGGLAVARGAVPGYAGGSCSATYCHGSFVMGNGANPISWGTGTPSKLACTACHGAPPSLTLHHPQGTACGDCHGAGYSATTVNAATHVDGLTTLAPGRTGCVACHGTPGRVGVSGADAQVAAAPPIGTRNETLTSTRAVGGHEAHTNKAAASGAINEPTACTACHGTLPTGTDTTHANGAVAMDAGAGWTGATTSCSNTCHGSAMPLGGGTNRTPNWVSGPSQATCGTCHGNPPPVIGNGHPQNPTCSTCHPAGYLQGSVAATAFAAHVNGTLDFNGTRTGCTSCHGDPARAVNPALATVTPVEGLANVQAMPPIDTLGNSTQANNGVGAHVRHVNDRSKPLLCAECHGTVPTGADTTHANGSSVITFLVSDLADGPATGPLVPSPALNPTYVETAGIGSCNSVYCHGASLPAAARGNNTAPSWNVTLDCNSCHGEPPGDAFHRTAGTRATCYTCHSQTTDNTGLILTANGRHVNGDPDMTINGVNGCAACHGTANRVVAGTLAQEIVVGAPPRALNGLTARTVAGVGAHEYHVNGSRSNSMACSECHGDSVIYGQNGMFSHADGTVQMAWGAIATARGATPGTFTPGTSTTCSSTYCHGNFPGGSGAGPTTAWTTNTASPQLGCTSCHGNPPALTAASHHPRNSACATCHGTGYSTTTVVQTSHVDGTFTTSRSGCTLCHGDLTATGLPASDVRVAPGANASAADVSGQTAATDPSVGAHAAHLNGTRWRSAPIACSECHAPVTDLTHATGAGTSGARATLAWGALATGAIDAWSGAAVVPTYTGSNTATTDTTTGSCGTTYCHGAFRNGNTRAMTWAGAAAAQTAAAACGTCHGTSATNPVPVTGHPAVANGTNCSGCHTGYDFVQGTGPASGTGVDPATHMNGRQEGGGHAAGWFEPAQHGTGPSGALASGVASCTSCHTAYGAPSGGAAEDSCNNCHATPSAYGKAYAAGATAYPNHASWQTECTFCHGTATTRVASHPGSNDTGAPLRDRTVTSLDVQTQDVTVAAVGAHSTHVGLGAGPTTTRNAMANRLACAACHGTTPADIAHVGGGAAAVSFANVGATANPGTYTPGTGCASNYCHGNFVGGAGTGNVAWNNATQPASCTLCHGSPPALVAGVSPHPQTGATACSLCHAGYTTAALTAAARGTHLDGTRQFPTGCTACHGDTTATPQPIANSDLRAAPGYNANAVDSHGNPGTAIAQRGVGAHNLHLTTALATPIACSECHGTLPANLTTTHAGGGNAALSWGTARAAAGGTTPTANQATPSVTCSSSWCHGATMPGSLTATNLAWNAASLTTTTCQSCHGDPPTATSTGHYHPQNANCSACHTGYANNPGAPGTIRGTNVAGHVNGAVEYVALACTTCHGTSGRANTAALGAFDANQAAAPPTDTTGASTGTRVGAHADHVNPSATAQTHVPVSCVTCHPNNVTNLHNTAAGGGATVVTFSGDAVLNGATPAYTGATPNCNATYCHGGTFAAGTRGTYAGGNWTWNNATAAACDSCHMMPPNIPAHSSYPAPQAATVCATCHDSTVNASGGIIFNGAGAAATTHHINGTVEGGDCTSCHAAGGPGTTGPNTRRDVVVEFTAAAGYSHKRSGAFTVTKYDCGVCHMEGDPASGNTVSPYHGNGRIELRDPDTGTEITTVAYTAATGSTAGSYNRAVQGTALSATATPLVRFSRNLGVGLENETAGVRDQLQAIMVRQCIGCHDANGANSAAARVSAGTAGRPFGTTIAGAGYLGSTGNTACATGTDGCVVNIDRDFAPTNSSYHPILSQQNNWYAKLTRMVAPWNGATRGGTVNATSWGYRMTCWDCHVPPGSSGTITRTVTAHGTGGLANPTTAYMRGMAYAGTPGTPTTAAPTTTNAVTLCNACHQYYNTCGTAADNCATNTSHGTNSAFSSDTGRSEKEPYLRYGCNACHSSGYSTAVTRPYRAQDSHGVNALRTPAVTLAGSRWAGASVGTPATVNARPYAFIRNAQGGSISLRNHFPRTIGSTSYGTSGGCTMGNGTSGTCNRSSAETYTAGGTY